MKNILIIQQDDAYFLFETLQVLEKNQSVLKEFNIQLFVKESSLNQIKPLKTTLQNITSDQQKILSQSYDMSINLSLDANTWKLHSNVESLYKIGPYIEDERLVVNDIWSSYFMTVKSGAPFLTFHLQDIYKNIIGIKRRSIDEPKSENFKVLAFGYLKNHLMSGDELETLIDKIHKHHPLLLIRDISELDLQSDLSKVLYIGPACFEAIRITEAGASGLFLSSHFQGFNLLPHGPNHTILSSRGKSLKAQTVYPVIEKILANQTPDTNSEVSIYKNDHENLYGAYLRSLNSSDNNYPVYQTHVVLWNFLLNLFETNLDVAQCSIAQQNVLQKNQMVLKKLIRLHEYAMSAIGKIHYEAKSNTAKHKNIEEYVKTLTEIEEIFDQIAASHPMLRAFIDFYKIRRGQNDGKTLLEQSQNSLILYSEEHHALIALDELFSVTLKKNEVNI